MRSKRELTWTNAVLREATALVTSAARTADGITLQVHGHYARPDAPGQALEGGMQLLVRPNGSIEVSYDYTPVNGQGLVLEAGLSLIVPTDAPEFRWLGAGPFAGYPGKDVLNEFGLYHLNRADLNFEGNRRAVELALLTDPAGTGLVVGGTGMDVAVERIPEGTVFSHNAILSGRGTKFAMPDTAFKAEAMAHIAGHFTLLTVGPTWPAALTTWFGPATATVKIFQPYYHSYDQ
jgi:beta-galactosidase